MPKKAPDSAGRKKLIALGLQLPLFPASPSGGLPKSTELLESRFRVSKGMLPYAELDRKEKVSTEMWIRQQERVGLDVLVEGEMSRSDMISHYGSRIEGFAPGGIVRVYGNRYYRRPVVRGNVAWKAPIVADTWRATQRMTKSPVKAILTGPYTLADWSFNEHYSKREALVRDLVAVLRRELTALAEAGAKIIQIDEPAMSARPAEFSLVADALKELVEGHRFYFILHHAFGDIAPIWKPMQSLPVDQFSLEMANSGMEFLKTSKKLITAKDIAVGIIDSHSRDVETPAVLKDRIKIACAAVPSGQLWLTADSGLRSRTGEEAAEKLKVLAQTAAKLRI